MIVYLLKNTVNGKGYVGKHKGDKIAGRWDKKLTGGNPHLNGARLLYGYAAFTRTILNVCLSEKATYDLEKFWIRELKTYLPEFGYNMTMGGEGYGIWTEERKDKFRKYAIEHQFGKWNKGKSIWNAGKIGVQASTRKDKTWEEIYGEEKALELKMNNKGFFKKGVSGGANPNGSRGKPVTQKQRNARKINMIEVNKREHTTDENNANAERNRIRCANMTPEQIVEQRQKIREGILKAKLLR